MSDLGQVLRDELGMRLEFERHYPDPPEDVWSAVVDPERMDRWLGTWSGDPTTGSVQFTMTSEPGAEPHPVAVQVCDPPHRLVVQMDGPEGAWPLALELTRVGDGTRLRFTHRLAEPYDATGVGPGWHYYLDRMEAVLHSSEVPSDWARYEALGASYPLPS